MVDSAGNRAVASSGLEVLAAGSETGACAALRVFGVGG